MQPGSHITAINGWLVAHSKPTRQPATRRRWGKWPIDSSSDKSNCKSYWNCIFLFTEPPRSSVVGRRCGTRAFCNPPAEEEDDEALSQILCLPVNQWGSESVNIQCFMIVGMKCFSGGCIKTSAASSPAVTQQQLNYLLNISTMGLGKFIEWWTLQQRKRTVIYWMRSANLVLVSRSIVLDWNPFVNLCRSPEESPQWEKAKESMWFLFRLFVWKTEAKAWYQW